MTFGYVCMFKETGSYIKDFLVTLITQTAKLTKVSCTKPETKGVHEDSKGCNHIPHSHKNGAFFMKISWGRI